METPESIFDEICEQETAPPDGLEWLPARAAPIRGDELYGGVRLKLWAILQESVVATFAKRGTALPDVSPTAFTDRFSAKEAKQKQWVAFLRKGKLEPLSFEKVISEVASFADPVVKSMVDGQIWVPGDGWVKN